MASRIAEAYVQIVPRIDGVAKGINGQLSGQMTSLGQTGATGFAAGFKKVAGPAIAAAIAVAGVALVKFGKDAIVAAEEAKKADARLDSIAKSMGIFGKETDIVSKRLKDYAKQNMLVMGADDEVIKTTQAKLLTFKNLAMTADETGGSFDRATKAAFDLASAGFGSAETNAVQLGKALQDPIKGISALARSGVTFTEVEKEKIKALVESGKVLEAQDMVLSAIEQQVGGTAEATLTATEKIRIGWGNVQESVGNLLLPAFDKIASVLSEKVFPAFENFFTSIKENGIGPTLQETFTNLSTLRQNLFDAIINALPGIIDAIVAFIPILVQNTVTMYTSILNAIVGALPQIIQAAITLFNGIIQGLLQVLPVIIQAIVTAIPQLINAIVSALPQIIDGAIKLFLGIVQGITRALPQIITAIVNAIPQIINAITDALPQLIDGAIELFLGIIEGLTDALPQIIDAIIEAMPKIVDALIKAVPLFIEAGLRLLEGVAKGMLDNLPRVIGAAIKGVADFAIETFKSLFGIKSPSTVFAGFGNDLMTGLAIGITTASNLPVKALEKAGKNMYRQAIDTTTSIADVLAGVPLLFRDDFVTQITDFGNGIFNRLEDVSLGLGDMLDPRGFMRQVGWGNDQLAFNQSLIDQITYARGTGAGGQAKQALQKNIDELGLRGNFQLGAGSGQGLADFLAGGITLSKGNKQVSFSGNAFSGNLDAKLQELVDAGFKIENQPGINQKALKDYLAGGGLDIDFEQIFGAVASSPIDESVKKAAAAAAQAAKKNAKKKPKKKKKKKKLATGGFVTNETDAIIGEAGPEVVYPLDRFEQIMGIDEGGPMKVVNYYAAPNNSLDSERALLTAMKRAKVIVGW